MLNEISVVVMKRMKISKESPAGKFFHINLEIERFLLITENQQHKMLLCLQ